ncbi:DUF4291 family protein [Streptomyces mirabilis]|uniref:DUF4291 family protein n=1 Tax=Streptomyces mirabilis TaxID=68239 RepID=UPI0036E31BEB
MPGQSEWISGRAPRASAALVVQGACPAHTALASWLSQRTGSGSIGPLPGLTLAETGDAESTIIAYQAYSSETGLPAFRDGRFPTGWKRDRMTWLAWPIYAAVLVSLLVAATLVTERQRRQWLLSTDWHTG